MRVFNGLLVFAVWSVVSLVSGIKVVPDGSLVSDMTRAPVVSTANLATSRTAYLRVSVSPVSDGYRSKRQSNGQVYKFQYSSTSITTPGGDTLYGILAPAEEIRAVLLQGVEDGMTGADAQINGGFSTSVNNLTYMMRLAESSGTSPTLTKLDFANVAKALLNDSSSLESQDPSDPSLRQSWVGVLSSPSGHFLAEIGIIPNVIVVPGPPPVFATPISGTSSKGSPAAKTIPRSLPPHKFRPAKRDQHRIPGTDLRLAVRKIAPYVPAHVLVILAKEVVDTVLLASQESYSALVTPDAFAEFFGPHVFSLVVTAGHTISREAMRAISLKLFKVAWRYTSGLQHRAVHGLGGQILDAAETIVAVWSIGSSPTNLWGGLPSAADVCPQLLVQHPDESYATCIRT